MFILLLIIGILTGILAGLFGIGGGVLFTPVLFFIFSGMTEVQNPVAWTIGTSLFCTFAAAFSSSVKQFQQHNSFIREGVMIGLFGAIGVYFGKLIVTSPYYTAEIFVIVFSALLLFVAFKFISRGRIRPEKEVDEIRVGKRTSLVTGGIGGFVASIAGVGGGIVVVPILNLWYSIPMAKSVSVSSLAVLIISFSGWMQYAFLSGIADTTRAWSIGYVDFGTGLPLIIGALIGGVLGVMIAKKVNQRKVQILFAIFTGVMAVVLLWRQFLS